jgi:hypothetical protein
LPRAAGDVALEHAVHLVHPGRELLALLVGEPLRRRQQPGVLAAGVGVERHADLVPHPGRHQLAGHDADRAGERRLVGEDRVGPHAT